MPLPDYIKKKYPLSRTVHGSWYLSSYNYKFNISRTRVWLQGLKEGKVLGLKCRSCNTVSFPPRLICGRCLVQPDEWVTLPETASVATGSATYAEDDEQREKAFPVIAVRQDGADTMLVHNLPDDYEFKQIYIGMPLKIHWAAEKKGLWMDIERYDPIPDPAKELNVKEEEKRMKK